MKQHINRTIRDLLIRQSDTLMLSRTKCSYKGEIYEFEEITPDEVEVKRLEILKIVNKKHFLSTILEKLTM